MNDAWKEWVIPAVFVSAGLVVGAFILIGNAVDRGLDARLRYNTLVKGIGFLQKAFERNDIANAHLLVAHLVLVARFGYWSGKAERFRREHADQAGFLHLDDDSNST